MTEIPIILVCEDDIERLKLTGRLVCGIDTKATLKKKLTFLTGNEALVILATPDRIMEFNRRYKHG